MHTKPITREIYKNRILKVINYIYQHVDQELSLEKLAKVAYFSPYHWHRIYHGITGETIHHTLLRLRLEKAAKSLVHSEDNIATV